MCNGVNSLVSYAVNSIQWGIYKIDGHGGITFGNNVGKQSKITPRSFDNLRWHWKF